MRRNPEWERGQKLASEGAVALAESLDDEVIMAVVPFAGAPPFEVSIYPEDHEWECSCGSAAEVCEHVIGAAIVLKAAQGGGPPPQDVDALLDRFPVRPEPEPEPEPEPPRPTPSRSANTRRASAATARSSASSSSGGATRTRRAREPVRRIRPPSVRRQPGPVRYNFEPTSYGLGLTRVVDYAGDVVAISRRLEGDDATGDRPVQTAAVDLLVQDALDGWGRTTVLSREHVVPLLTALADAEDVRLEGKPVATSTEPVTMVVVLEDAPNRGLRLSLTTEPAIDRRWDNGVCLVDGVLRPMDDKTGLGRSDVHRLLIGETHAHEDIYQLVVQTLPDLQRHVSVRILSERVPEAVLSEARPAVYTEVVDGAITAEGRVVYGDPVLGMVVRNRMIVVGDAVPIREPDEERPAAQEIHRALGLVPGIAKTFGGPAAAAFAAKLARWEEEADDCEIVGDGWRELLPG